MESVTPESTCHVHMRQTSEQSVRIPSTSVVYSPHKGMHSQSHNALQAQPQRDGSGLFFSRIEKPKNTFMCAFKGLSHVLCDHQMYHNVSSLTHFFFPFTALPPVSLTSSLLHYFLFPLCSPPPRYLLFLYQSFLHPLFFLNPFTLLLPPSLPFLSSPSIFMSL